MLNLFHVKTCHTCTISSYLYICPQSPNRTKDGMVYKGNWSPLRKRSKSNPNLLKQYRLDDWFQLRYKLDLSDLPMDINAELIKTPESWNDTLCHLYVLTCTTLLESHQLLQNVQEQVQKHEIVSYAHNQKAQHSEGCLFSCLPCRSAACHSCAGPV